MVAECTLEKLKDTLSKWVMQLDMARDEFNRELSEQKFKTVKVLEATVAEWEEKVQQQADLLDQFPRRPFLSNC